MSDKGRRKIAYLHDVILEKGIEPYSDEYLAEMDNLLEGKPEQQQQRTSIVSAPVSREAPSSGGTRTPTKITLTPAQKEAAKIAGISETEYAKHELIRQERVKNGYYGAQS